MTITPPTVQPVTVAPPETIFRGATDVQPFTYRSGMTYTQILESIRVWLRNTLVPYLNTNFEDLAGSWLENVTAIDTAVNLALQQQADTINSALTVQQQQVADELATTLQQVTSGESAALNDAAVHNALLVANSTALALLDGRYTPAAVGATFRALRLEGAGIDPTGATASDAAVQAIIDAAPAGASLVVPEGSVIGLSAGLTVGKRLKITGGGELRYIGTNPGIILHATVDGTQFEGLYLTNPNGTTLVTGIVVEANIGRVLACRIVGMNDGIQVAPTGEWHDIVIANNEVLDVIGSGTGASNGNWSTGESNGDGIVSWGAAVVITGNRVTAKTGRDARIGIHVENLSNREVIPYSNADSLATITGNVVTGPFRRGIVTEGVQHANITANTIADVTMWAVAVIGLAHHTVVAANTIKHTSAVVTGQPRAGIMLYAIQETLTDVSVLNNTIRGAVGSQLDYGIVSSYDQSVSALSVKNSRIRGNEVYDDSTTLADGVHISGATDMVEVCDNHVAKFSGVGIYANQAARVRVSGNSLYGRGSGTSAAGIHLEGGAAEGEIDGNVIRDVNTAIKAFFRTVLLSVTGNKVVNTATGINTFSATSPLQIQIALNLFVTVTAAYSGIPTNGGGFNLINVGNNA